MSIKKKIKKMSLQTDNVILFSVDELSKRLRMDSATIRTYIKEGKLKGRKAGGRWYISQGSLIEFFWGKPSQPAEKKM